MRKPLFDRATVARWRRASENGPPNFDDREVDAIPKVDSFIAAGLDKGIAFRLKMQDGSIVDISLNPLLARAMGVLISKAGDQAGWLDGQGNLSFPAKTLDH